MTHSPPVIDQRGRPLGTLRLSLTDRCNLRCGYCMPEEHYRWLPREDCLSLEEHVRLVRLSAALGARRFRITGGEPLLRRNISFFVRQAQTALAEVKGSDLAMTTNALLLAEHAEELKQAGLSRVTISLDTLRADRFAALTRRNALDKVFAGIEAAREVGFSGSKLNSVIMRGFNEDEIADLLEYGRGQDIEVRYIEYMDVGGATGWHRDKVVSSDEIIAVLRRRFGAISQLPRACADTAQRYQVADGTVFSIIASTTKPFCNGCDRSRVTADGTWYHCLYAPNGFPLRSWLRQMDDDAELLHRMRQYWQKRNDQGAVKRLAMADSRGPLVQIQDLKLDPRLEMHTRGG